MTLASSADAYQLDENGALFSPQYDDHYRSKAGAFAESLYVFCCGCDLPESVLDKDELSVAETGFGAGYNFAALLSCLAERNDPLTLVYHAVEEAPLPRAVLAEAWQGEAPAELAERFLPLWPEAPRPGGVIEAEVSFGAVSALLRVAAVPLSEAGTALVGMPPVDVWFLDGFAPAKNPGMWGDDLFRWMGHASAPECRFATFTAAGEVRRGLEALGFHCERRKGFADKRHMTSGYRRRAAA